MTDAPERIWIDHMTHEHHWHESGPIEGSRYAHEFSGPYIRADIHQAALQAAYAEGLEAAAREVGLAGEAERKSIETRAYPTLANCEAIADDIRALPNKYGKASQ